MNKCFVALFLRYGYKQPVTVVGASIFTCQPAVFMYYCEKIDFSYSTDFIKIFDLRKQTGQKWLKYYRVKLKAPTFMLM